MTELSADLLTRSRAVLLDFDGPICSVFSGYPADVVALNMVDLLRSRQVFIPEELERERDPIEVLRWTGDSAPEYLIELESHLVDAECEAIMTAEPTPFADSVMRRVTESGRVLAIVSNNSAYAVAKYLIKNRLDSLVSCISGRAFGIPTLMKPDPSSLIVAVRRLGSDPGNAVLVGDSVSDIEASHAAGVRSVGYANKTGKVAALSDAGADVVVESMSSLL